MYMQCTIIKAVAMSFDFGSSNINQIKTQAAYKDGGGMGGGGMDFQPDKKRKGQREEDLFQFKGENDENEILLEKEIDEKDIPQDTLFNKFVNWFRLKH